jgi:serine/threonine-protein kinase
LSPGPAPTHTATLAAGKRLERYELLCPVAEGGMASIWAARQHGKYGFEKLVAVKTILPELARQPHFRSMFLDEARIASRVDHPNVARILDVGEEDDVLYLVMEWVDGDSLWSLRQRLSEEGRTLPAGILLRILADVCGGLHAVHEIRDASGTRLSVVHRDVSPDNILVDLHGSAKLIDFGVAKARNRYVEETVTGVLKGKLHYMAPEQALFRPVDRRTDIWAVGAILYRFFAGVPPYRGETREETLLLLGSGAKPAPLPPTVPLAVATVTERALMYNPDERYATAAELKAALEAALVAIHARTTTEDVAEFVSTRMADVIEARRAATSHAARTAPGRPPDPDDQDDNVPTPVLDWPKLPLEPDDPLAPIMSAAGAPDLAFASPLARRSPRRGRRAFLVVAIVAFGILGAALGRRERTATTAFSAPVVVAPPVPTVARAPPPSSVVPPLRMIVGTVASAAEPTKAVTATSPRPAPRARPAPTRPRRVARPPRATPVASTPAVAPAPAAHSAVDDGF